MSILTGGVTRIVQERGFAFVRSGEQDYFLHHTELQNCSFNKLQVGDQVKFEAVETPKGLRANNASRV
jgi:cold shock CspA family protein